MLKNYIKTAFRNLLRNKSFSIINIAGLAIGIGTCLLLMLYVENELSYDRFNEKADRIVRVIFRGAAGGGEMNEANVMPPTAQVLKADYPEVLDATRLRQGGVPVFNFQQKTFNTDQFAFADSNFFDVFTLPLIVGNSKTALLQPNTAVISEEMAHKYFGKENPIGKVLINKSYKASYKITGVMKKIPANSHFHFDLFVSMSSSPEASKPDWMSSSYFTYLVLPKEYDYKKLEAKLPQVVEKYMGPQIQKVMGLTFAEFKQKGNRVGLNLQPLTDIHLYSHLSGELDAGGDIKYVYIFSAISVFMLIIACINFMNLSTAGASKRAKEIGIRKVLGSEKIELVKQFLTESVLVSFLALAVSLLLVFAALPLFNQLSGIHLSLDISQHIWFLPGLLLFGMFVGVLAGIYPAFFLSSFKPILVLKGKFAGGNKTIGLRSGLVVIQFFISITLIVCTTVVYKQLTYIQNKELGYQKENVLVIPNTYFLGANEHAFFNQLIQDSRITSATVSGYVPAGSSYSNNFMVYPDNNSSQIVKTVRYDVDYNYVKTLGMKIIMGRNFSKSFGTDSTGIVLNETAIRIFGWDKKPIGHTLTYNQNNGNKIRYKVIGVVNDFHFKSLRESISPLVMTLGNNNGSIILKTKTANPSALLSAIKNKWDAYNTGASFTYSFLDESFINDYRSELKIGKILSVFAGLTVFVASLGLLALAMFTARQRTKEIGIRKVLGASVFSITTLLSKDFVKLVLVALVIASPFSWYIMGTWLQDFEYRTNIQWWMFALAGFLAMLIALITISFQTIKAALTNPVKSLRTE